jgi:hypothetical protein
MTDIEIVKDLTLTILHLIKTFTDAENVRIGYVALDAPKAGEINSKNWITLKHKGVSNWTSVLYHPETGEVSKEVMDLVRATERLYFTSLFGLTYEEKISHALDI